jgi:nucleoside phosphorylase
VNGYEGNRKPWIDHLKKHEGKLRKSNRPGVEFDLLNIDDKVADHPIDPERIATEPKVHHGPIGSSNTLLKNEKKRDMLRDQHGVICIEMEGSGIPDGTWALSKGYLIVRGIVDYCNSDKNDHWHNYAATCAACYVKAIIEKL